MISPEGLAINPRIPASCFICCAEPRAPELAIMAIELNEVWRPVSGSTEVSIAEISFIISSATLSVHCAHASTTLL